MIGPEAMGESEVWEIPSDHLVISFLMVRMTRYMLPTDTVECLLIEIVKSLLDMAISNCLYVTLPEQGVWMKQPPEVPSNLSYSVIFRSL